MGALAFRAASLNALGALLELLLDRQRNFLIRCLAPLALRIGFRLWLGFGFRLRLGFRLWFRLRKRRLLKVPTISPQS